MESRSKKSGGAKRNRSLDLKSLYTNKASDVGGSEKKVLKENDLKSIKKRRRSKKEVSLSCFESDLKKSRKVDVDGLKPDIGISQKSSIESKGLHGISLALAENGKTFNIPKRPRGSIGGIKLEGDQVSKPLQHPNSVAHVGALNGKVIKPKDEAATNDLPARLVAITASNDGASNSKSAGKVGDSNPKIKQKGNSKSASKVSSSEKSKQKAGADRNVRSLSVRDAEKGFGKAVNSGDASSKKRLTNSRKKKGVVDGTAGDKATKKNLEPAVGSLVADRLVGFDEDDDEENLEANAARMLSSRFDPSCTGFSSKRKSSASQKAKAPNCTISSTRDLSRQRAGSSGCVDSPSADDKHRTDDTSRSLRPRREDKGRNATRKRRHFYDILPGNVEPHWFLQRKIKIFWPLDESWYYGCVNDYHPECKLFHVKYDDGEEEWIDLQEEKFKLLLFPSEIPGKAKPKKPYKVENEIHKVEMVPPEAEDMRRGNYLDSVPIASWLVSSSQSGKSLPKSSEMPRTSAMELPAVSSFSYEKAINLKSKVAGSKRSRSKGDCESVSADKPVMGSANGFHAVYVRKKNRKMGEAYGSASTTVNSVALTVSLPTSDEDGLCDEFFDSDKQSWSIDRQGKLRLNVRLVVSKKLRFQICLPLLPSRRISVGIEYFRWLHDILMVQHGVIRPASGTVVLEMLFVDTYIGLKFFLFEGCMKLALKFIFQILNLFNKPDQLPDGKMQSPATSMRFRLSSVQDVRKHHVFEFHCFSRLQSSEWVCLDSRLLQHCLLLKRLPASECTYDNFTELEYQSLKQCKRHDGLELTAHAGFSKQFAWGILPIGISKDACTTRTCSSALNLAKKPGNFYISFSATPTIFLTSHLRLLMENSFGIPHLEQVDVPLGGKRSRSRQGSDTDCGVDRGFAHIPDPTGPQCSLWSGRSRTIPSAHGNLSPTRLDRSPKFMHIGFSNGPKKPRTKVQYTMPDAGYDFHSKQKMKNQQPLPCKRIRRARPKRMSDGSMDNQKNFEVLNCGANVLVTHGDKGWRECGALIVLEVADRNEWRLAIKLAGVTKYSYKVKHILQPGTTNRHSHAILWKGGKDWLLEFPDRSQWNLFKEMYEECYNRNVRAASVKNIPIPGVKLIVGSDDCGSEVHFVQSSTEYFKQVQSDVDMALDPSHILYDMDSDDEKWLMANKKYNDEDRCEEISEDLLEKTMDMFEKVSYVQHRDSFTVGEIQEIVNRIVSVEAAKVIYEHWREKRSSKGMPLIRHLQPPLWQRYQWKLKEWEDAVARRNSAVSVGIQEKVPPPKKPPMFAFCLKPRKLDVPDKGSKQRSHRKFPVSRYNDGRRSYGHIFGHEKLFYTNNIHEYLDFPPPLWSPSMRMLSPQDSNFSFSTNLARSKRRRRLFTNKRRKVGRYPSLNNLQMLSYYQRTLGNGNRNGSVPWNMGLPDLSNDRHCYLESSLKQVIENIDVSDLDDLQLRDASGAAQYALNIAKLKREKARRLFNRADVAVHKAMVALMTADAIKAAYENSNGGN